MNERIKELERQATETVKCGLNGTSTTESFNRKKFAELIVKKCIFAVEDAGGIDKYHYTKAIREHFGVEL